MGPDILGSGGGGFCSFPARVTEIQYRRGVDVNFFRHGLTSAVTSYHHTIPFRAAEKLQFDYNPRPETLQSMHDNPGP